MFRAPFAMKSPLREAVAAPQRRAAAVALTAGLYFPRQNP
jgi:hypothetical protein